MTALALTPDTLGVLVVVGLAVLFLGVRVARFLRPRAGGGCACPSASACGGKGPSLADLRAAAARGAARVNRGSTSVAR